MKTQNMKYLPLKPIFRGLITTVVVLMLLAISSCGPAKKSYHSVIMRGSVIDIKDNKVHLCIGSRDGASVGQTLKVFRVKKVTVPNKSQLRFKRIFAGKIKISKIVDEHFAMASIVEGTAKEGNIVELER